MKRHKTHQHLSSSTSQIFYSLNDLPSAASWLLERIGEHRVVAFYGAMGAGKTTLIRELCSQMRVADNVASPTFALVNEYHTADYDKIFHFDFYRIKTLEEAYDIGCDEYFYGGSLCLIEWPELVEPLLPDDCLRVHITPESEERRAIALN
jgi:tRNA threonylcarbamoyladenosine biosynthesis protein TsaE